MGFERVRMKEKELGVEVVVRGVAWRRKVCGCCSEGREVFPRGNGWREEREKESSKEIWRTQEGRHMAEGDVGCGPT